MVPTKIDENKEKEAVNGPFFFKKNMYSYAAPLRTACTFDRTKEHLATLYGELEHMTQPV